MEVKAPQEIITTEEEKKEFGSLSYYEVTGRPDTRPDKFEDLAPNITYSSSGRAYVGFNNKQEAEEFRDTISEPSMIGDTDTMNGFKYEVKFYCSREYVQQIGGVKPLQSSTADSVNSMSDEPIETFEEINPRVIYNHQDKAVYIGMTAKNRCDYYGQVLTGQLTVGEKYTYSNKPSYINAEEYKYELRISEIELDDAVKLADFNLQKDPEHKDNRELLSQWQLNRKREIPSAYKPSPKLVPLEEIKLGDIVYLNSIDNQYKVLGKVELDGVPHIEVLCVFNSERPSLVSATSFLKECYLVPAESIQIDPALSQEEVLTEDVQIYVPKEKEATVKKSEDLSEVDFPASPYKSIELSELEFGDIITSTPYTKSAYEVIGVNTEYATAVCLYHQALPGRVGEQYTFANPYLVEKAFASVSTEERATEVPIPA